MPPLSVVCWHHTRYGGTGLGPTHTGPGDVVSPLSNVETWLRPPYRSPKLGTEVVACAGVYKTHSFFHLQRIVIGGQRKDRC